VAGVHEAEGGAVSGGHGGEEGIVGRRGLLRLRDMVRNGHGTHPTEPGVSEPPGYPASRLSCSWAISLKIPPDRRVVASRRCGSSSSWRKIRKSTGPKKGGIKGREEGRGGGPRRRTARVGVRRRGEVATHSCPLPRDTQDVARHMGRVARHTEEVARHRESLTRLSSGCGAALAGCGSQQLRSRAQPEALGGALAGYGAGLDSCRRGFRNVLRATGRMWRATGGV
jgi:hypothetical protein